MKSNSKIISRQHDSPRLAKKGAIFVRFLPSTLTISAFCFGLTSIKMALFHRWEVAVMCIFVSALLDAFDGKVARLLGQSSQFGAELDSLSDLVCFGVAPSVILFLRSIYALGNVGWGICMFFTICCALRLARFNAMKAFDEQKPEWAQRYFSGVPAPAGAILVMFPLILFFETGNYAFLNPVFVTFCLLISGTLMISTLKTFSSKIMEINSGSALISLLSISFLVICLITELWLTLSIITIIYIVLIPYGIHKYSKALEIEEIMREEQKAL